MKKMAMWLVAVLALSVGVHAQTGSCSTGGAPKCTDNQTLKTPGTIKVPSNGGMTPTFAYTITGSPATISIALLGCVNVTTPCDALNTYTTVASALYAPSISKAYNYYLLNVSWIGGTNVSVQVNTVITTSRQSTGSLPCEDSAGVVDCTASFSVTENNGYYSVQDANGNSAEMYVTSTPDAGAATMVLTDASGDTVTAQAAQSGGASLTLYGQSVSTLNDPGWGTITQNLTPDNVQMSLYDEDWGSTVTLYASDQAVMKVAGYDSSTYTVGMDTSLSGFNGFNASDSGTGTSAYLSYQGGVYWNDGTGSFGATPTSMQWSYGGASFTMLSTGFSAESAAGATLSTTNGALTFTPFATSGCHSLIVNSSGKIEVGAIATGCS